jgi:hypothetical protein
MEQPEIDALMGGGPGKGSQKKNKGGAPAPKSAAPAPKPAAPAAAPAPSVPAPAAAKPPTQSPKPEPPVRVIGELGAVTAVTERETNKVMDKLDEISRLLDQQRNMVNEIMGSESAQNPGIKNSIQQILTAGNDIQNKVYEAMDLMQFQDISRQKLERIMHHLRQIHDYILDLLGTGFQSEQPHKVSLSHSISDTGTTPDEKKSQADAVINEYLTSQKKD